MKSSTCKMICKNCYHETQAHGFAKDKLLHVTIFLWGVLMYKSYGGGGVVCLICIC